MKRTPSVVWRFFDRIEQDGRVVAIVCKLCDARYKYFGNTTNLRCHLVNKHPIQWELGQNGSLEEGFRVAATDDETNPATPRPRQKRYRKTESNDNVRYSISVNKDPNILEGMPIIKVDVLESETDIEQHGDDTQATINLVKQFHRGSDEEWLNEEVFDTVTETFTQPKRKRKVFRKIKREVPSPPPPTSYEPKKQIFIQNNRTDEYNAFGEYVSNKLRKFNSNQTRSNVQQLITTILWQAEYGVYDNMDTVKRILLHSMQDMGSPGDQAHIRDQEQEDMNATDPIAE